MTPFARSAIAAYLVVLTLGLLAGQWYLQGPLLFGGSRHGLHVGDVVVLVGTTVAVGTVMRRRR